MKLRTYINSGLVIIPTEYKGKRPLIKWGRYIHTKPTEEEYKLWFNGELKNLAVVAGKLSGVCIIDFDSQEAIDNNPDLSSINTFTVKSNRGIHKYFKYPQDKDLINISKHDNYKDIDFKMSVCLCTLPPSIHKSGHKYSVIEGDINSLAELPDKIVKLCTRKRKRFVFNKDAWLYNNPVLKSVTDVSIHRILYDNKIHQKDNHSYYCYKAHDQDSASLMVYDTNTYYCFGCGESGNPINLIIGIKNMSKEEAVNYLKDNYC